MPKTLTHGLEQCAAATQYDIRKEILSHIIITLHDRVKAILVHSFKVMPRQLRIE